MEKYVFKVNNKDTGTNSMDVVLNVFGINFEEVVENWEGSYKPS